VVAEAGKGKQYSRKRSGSAGTGKSAPVVYVGPFAAGVTIVATGQHAVPGVPVVVPAALAAALCEQAVWESPPAVPAGDNDQGGKG